MRDLFPELEEQRLRAVVVQAERGKIVSALMKSIRLQREADALYWMAALLRAGIDRKYLGRRCFGSACEDSLSLPAMEMGGELARRPSRHLDLPYFQSVLASCRGAKWYWPAAREYTLCRCQAWEAPRGFEALPEAELLQRAAAALGQGDALGLMLAHRECCERRRGGFALLDILLEQAETRERPIRRLAALCTRHSWLVVTREPNPVWQLIWTLCRGPFRGSEAPVNLKGLDHLLNVVQARWAAPDLEPVPGWCLDGVHTTGSDERFAGTWLGLRNMVAMYARYGRLDPDDEGIVVRPGESRGRKGMGPVPVSSKRSPGEFHKISPKGDRLCCT